MTVAQLMVNTLQSAERLWEQSRARKVKPLKLTIEEKVPSDIEIAMAQTPKPVAQLAQEIGLVPDELESYGKYKAKIDLRVIDRLSGAPDAKIVCVSAITPTKAGEGKTTTSVSLTQGLGAIGKRPILCLREPSLGPIVGIKGGAAGGHRRGCEVERVHPPSLDECRPSSCRRAASSPTPGSGSAWRPSSGTTASR